MGKNYQSIKLVFSVREFDHNGHGQDRNIFGNKGNFDDTHVRRDSIIFRVQIQ